MKRLAIYLLLLFSLSVQAQVNPIFDWYGPTGSYEETVSETFCTPSGTKFVRTIKGLSQEFEGGAELVSMPSDVSFSSSENATFEIWCKGELDGAVALLGKSLTPIYSQILTNSNVIYIEGDESSNFAYATLNDISDKWHHILITKNGTAIQVYQNSVALTMTNAVMDTSITFNQIGNRATNGGFVGNISRTRIYSSALTQPQIDNLYAEYQASHPRGQKKDHFPRKIPTSLTEDSLKAAYNMVRQAGDVLTDISGSGATGTVVGTSQTIWGLQFDGVDDWASLTTFNINEYTVNARFKLNGLDKAQSILGWYKLYIRENNSISIFDGTAVVSSTGTLESGVWYNVSVVQNGTTVKFYINGALDSEKSVAGYFTPVHAIGSRKNDIPIDFFDGQIQDLQIYNRALSLSEVQAYHNSFLTGSQGLLFYDTYTWEGVGNLPFGIRINSGTFLLAEAASVLDQSNGKYINCSANGSMQINLGTTDTDKDATIYFYDGSWTKHAGILSDLITAQSWLSLSEKNLIFTMTSGQYFGHIIIKNGISQ